LRSFQEALRLKPDSKEVKKNIELMIASGGGDGDGEQQKQQEGKDKQDNKDGQGQKPPEKPQDQPKKGPTPKPTPKPFQSDQLNQQDVGRILEEIKRQEDQIRDRIQREGAKDAPRDKDW